MQLVFSTDATHGANQLYERLTAELQAGKRVLWLLPGGSNIPVCKEIIDRLDPALTASLSLALTDERYGPMGHPDSNWQQLDDIGFDRKAATVLPTLADEALSLEQTAERYGAALQELWQQQDIVVGQFGMGGDGHIAGILPNTPATTATSFVTGYHTDEFDRITTTFTAIAQCSVAYLFAFGASKHEALQNLQAELTLADQPAQILKQIPEAYVFNDQIGDPS